MDLTDELKFRILMCLFDSVDSNCSVTGISRTLQQEKYVISRTMIRMEQEGLIDRTNTRAPKLTETGRKVAKRYRDRVEIALNHLIYEGVDLEHAKKDSCIWAMYCSDETMEAIRVKDEGYRVRRILKDKKKFDGGTLCRHMKNGTYSFPFVIYREYAKGNNIVSMANKGFEHPCTLYVEDGKGVIQLQVVNMSEKSVLNGVFMSGMANKFQYFDSGRFVDAEFYGDIITFPARVLEFINIGSGSGQVLHGSVSLRMQCSVGISHMPEAEAFFSMII